MKKSVVSKRKHEHKYIHSVMYIFYQDGWSESGRAQIEWRRKSKLIEFYKANPTLWDTSDQYYKNKVKRLLIKKRLVELFEDKFSEEHLEKTFHSLRTSMSREVKKLSSGVTPKNKWKYFDHMEFLRADLNKKKAVIFEIFQQNCMCFCKGWLHTFIFVRMQCNKLTQDKRSLAKNIFVLRKKFAMGISGLS